MEVGTTRQLWLGLGGALIACPVIDASRTARVRLATMRAFGSLVA